MKSTYTNLMQSKYFSPAFNSAIFDGPLRIYFAQFHESIALKIYFLVQQKLKDEMAQMKEMSKISGSNILVMVYPTDETFAMTFESAVPANKMICETWNADYVIGVCGALEDSQLEGLIQEIHQGIIHIEKSLPSFQQDDHSAIL